MQMTRTPFPDRGNNLAKMMMADIATVCSSLGLTVSEAKTETMCLVTKRMDRVPSVTEAAC